MDLENIAEHARDRDISDPSCMDKILIYLERLKVEDEDFMQEITWDQPWYQQGHSLTRPLKDHYENEVNIYRKDTISKEENEIIQKNWRKFRKKYGMPDKLISFARWKNQDKTTTKSSPVEHARRYLTAYLARGLERTLYQVYRHVLTYYGCPNKRSYQPYELKIMEICFTHYPTRAVTCLSKVLGREPRRIYYHLEAKFNGKLEKKRLKWTLPLATKFLKLLLKYTELPQEELENLRIEKSVWLKMQNDMDHNYVNLYNFWYGSLHVQLFVKSDVKLSRVKKKVFKILRDTNYKVWTDIRWKELLNHFPSAYTHRFLYKICSSICRKYPNYLTAPLEEIVEHGLRRSRLYRYRNRRLKTVKMNADGNLEYVNYSKCEE